MTETLFAALLLLPLLLLASYAAPFQASAPLAMAGGAMLALATCGTVILDLAWIGLLRGVEAASRASRGRLLRLTDTGAGELCRYRLLPAPVSETAQAP